MARSLRRFQPGEATATAAAAAAAAAAVWTCHAASLVSCRRRLDPLPVSRAGRFRPLGGMALNAPPPPLEPPVNRPNFDA